MTFPAAVRFTILFGLLAGVTAPAFAQLTTGTVTGTVQDQQQVAVPGVTVTMVSETRGTTVPAVVTGASGNYVFVNLAPDTYKVLVSLQGFKTVTRGGIAVSPGDRVALPTIRLEVGGLSETITVTAETSLIQAQSGERSFTIDTTSVQNLPNASRSFTNLATIAPGVTLDNNNTPVRVGGGGSTNIMMDGVSANDTGSNRPIVQVNVESIAEVKVLTSGYQAEFGRNSGVQVSAVTKSGTNKFHGSLYDVERNSDWNANSKVNVLNGDPKAVVQQRDWGFSLGGPIGKAGGGNKLFFFFAQEFEPRKAGGDTQRYRVPTALERAGDFSQSYDNNGALYALIKDPQLTSACSATVSAGCFQDGGVIGRIPASRLYQPGLNALNTYPMPTLTGTAAAGLAYNYEVTRPTEHTASYQPAVRVDYQPSSALRGTFKFTGWRQQNNTFNGTIPGYNDSKMYKPVITTYAATVNYTLTAKTFLEVTFGHAKNDLTGCALGQSGTGPVFCTAGAPGGPAPGGFAMNPVSNRLTAGLASLPTLFDAATMFVVDPSFYAYKQLSSVAPPWFVNGQVLHSPTFTWTGGGSKVANAPPATPFPAFLNDNSTYDLSGSVTHVMGRHTIKGGYYQTYSLKDQAPNGQAALFGNITFANDANNPIDTTFPFANAAVGVASTYNQLSRFLEAKMVAWNIEGYLQDNWKINTKLTLDYGLRLVHQTPMYDANLFASTFVPNKYNVASAPTLYVAGCPGGAVTCAGSVRQAKNPITGQLAGTSSSVLIGTIIPGSGNVLNGIAQAGQGVNKTVYEWPAMGYAPRFGAAYDLTGQRKFVVRGGIGLYFDRPAGNAVLGQISNPPALQNTTVKYAQLQTIGAGSAGFSPQGALALSVFQQKMGLPSSGQWNVGIQMALPWASTLDLAYVGQHSWNQLTGVNINSVDIGTAYLAQNQDPTLSSPLAGGNALPTDNLRAIRGFGAITMQQDIGWNTFHSIQASFQRRFNTGVSFGFSDAFTLENQQLIAPRLQHSADGSYITRADQAQAQSFLQTDPVAHTLKANVVWDPPNMQAGSGIARHLLVGAVNDWQFSGIWSGTTAAPYTVGFNFGNAASTVNLTGSPDFAPRITINGDPGSGCSSDALRQYSTAAFAGTPINLTGDGVGLESSPNRLKGCFQSALDLAIARIIRVGKSRTIQLKVEVFNAPNQAIVTGRNTTIQFASPNTPTVIAANTLPFDSTGAVVPSKSLPKNAGPGVATTYQSPRTVQMQVRFGF